MSNLGKILEMLRKIAFRSFGNGVFYLVYMEGFAWGPALER